MTSKTSNKGIVKTTKLTQPKSNTQASHTLEKIKNEPKRAKNSSQYTQPYFSLAFRWPNWRLGRKRKEKKRRKEQKKRKKKVREKQQKPTKTTNPQLIQTQLKMIQLRTPFPEKEKTQQNKTTKTTQNN